MSITMTDNPFDRLPSELIAIVVDQASVLDYRNLSLAGCRRITHAISSARSRLSRTDYLNRIAAHDASDKGLPKGEFRKPMEIMIERGRPDLVLHYKAKYTRIPQAMRGDTTHKVEYSIPDSTFRNRCENNSFALALHFAAYHGQEQIARLMMDRVNHRAGKANQTALHYAAGNNQVHMVALLLDHGAYINAYDDRCLTPLATALSKGAHQAAELLKRYGGQTELGAALDCAEWAREALELSNLLRFYIPWKLRKTDTCLERFIGYCWTLEMGAPEELGHGTLEHVLAAARESGDTLLLEFISDNIFWLWPVWEISPA